MSATIPKIRNAGAGAPTNIFRGSVNAYTPAASVAVPSSDATTVSPTSSRRLAGDGGRTVVKAVTTRYDVRVLAMMLGNCTFITAMRPALMHIVSIA